MDLTTQLQNYSSLRGTPVGTPTTSADAMKQMQDFNSSRMSLSDIYRRSEDEVGVGKAQQRANELKALASGTEKLIKNVDPSVTGRMQGSMATEAQRQRLVNLETQPLSELYRTQTGAYETGKSEYENALSRAQQLASQRYGSDTEKYNMLKDLYGTLQGQESAAEEKRRYEAEMQRIAAEAAEDTRRWEAQMAEARQARNTAPSFNLGDYFSQQQKQSSQQAQTQANQAMQQEAYNSVKNMLASKDPKRIEREIAAITKSAGYGNQRDKLKLEAIAQLGGSKYKGKKVVSVNALGNGGQLRF